MKSLALIAALTAIALHAYSKKIEGTIITKGKSISVIFNIKVPFLGDEPNFERIQYKVAYYNESGKKQILHPDDADEIQFEYEGMNVRMISCINTIGFSDLFSPSTRIFLKLEIDGPLRLYRYYYKQTTGGYGSPGGSYAPATTYTVDNFIFQKGKGPLKQPKGLGWKKDMSEYFSDCPALGMRINMKELKRREIEAIVMYYNQNCGKK